MPSSQLVSGLWPSKGKSTIQARRAARTVEVVRQFRAQKFCRLNERVVFALLLSMRNVARDSASGMVFPLGVVFEIGAVKINLAQITGTVAFRLIVEVRR